MQDEPSKSSPRIRVKREPGIYYREGARGRRYMFPYRDSDGKQRWKTVEGGLQDAKDERNAMRRKLRGGEVVRPIEHQRMAFQDVADEWLRRREGRIGERTHERYGEQLRSVYADIGGLYIAGITRERLAE